MTECFEKPIFVLGLPRSGTSLIAGMLGHCNVWLGHTLQNRGKENPRGFFEHIILREQVIKQMLRQLGCDPLGVQKLPPLGNLPRIQNLQDIIRQVLGSEGYANSHPWLFKDAKLTLLWPAFMYAFPNARWVIVRRDVNEVIDSCLNTAFMSQHSLDRSFWKRWADEYLDRLEQLKSATGSCYEIWPGALMEGDLTEMNILATSLGLEWEDHTVSQFIDRSFWHGN